MTFASMDAFNAAMGSPLTGDVMNDVAKYTSIVPVMQISEVVS
ncbi:MAG: EthD family reductase, partial [Actinobacteria bacterium]|nr:EthD family reductase [Actinomycetota bacterium]